MNFVVEPGGHDAGVHQLDVSDCSIVRLPPQDEAGAADTGKGGVSGGELQSELDPEILKLFKVRFNELMAEGGDFRTITFTDEQLEARGLPASENWHVVENAVWSVVKSGPKEEKKLPRQADVATLDAFRAYFHARILSEIEALPLHLPIEQMKKKARSVIGIIHELRHEGISPGFNRESVLGLEYHIEELRRTGALKDAAGRMERIDVYGSFLGECIILYYGGVWTRKEGTWCVAFDEQRAVFPFTEVQNQIECGAGKGIERFFSAIPERFGLEPVCPKENPRVEFIRSLLDLENVLRTPEGRRYLLSRRPRAPVIVEQLQEQLMAYFAQPDEEAAIGRLRDDVGTNAGTARVFRDGIAQVLDDARFDCVGLVEGCANHKVNRSEREAREWLHALFKRLFPGAPPPPI